MLAKLARALALALFLTPFALQSFASFSPALAKPIVEVAFVLDTTGSMGPLIEGAKRKTSPKTPGDSFDRTVEEIFRAQIKR